MKENKLTQRNAIRWKKFNHKGYSAFCSLKKEINIGVLIVSTLLFANVNITSAQNETTEQLRNHELEEVEVSGTRVPLTEAQSVKMVTVLSRDEIQAAAVHSINDLLKYVAGVDIRQRGGFGVQTDILVQGGTFDQTTILLNGINISSPQTGHLTADFPVSIDDIERIEILEGAASRVFGTSAFTGAINIITKNDPKSHAAINISGGSYGLFDGGGKVNITKGAFSQQISASYNRSDGGTENSDFHTKRAYYHGTYSDKEVDIRWQMGMSKQKFGANTFYSAAYPNQYEEVNRHLISVQAETKGRFHFTPSLYWNHWNDHFQLIRNTHTAENFHMTDVYGINLNAYLNSTFGKTAFGSEIRNEGILSTNLGRPLDASQYVDVPGEKGIQYTKKDNRTNISYYLEHNILLPKVTISMGVLANMNTALDHKYRLYPGIDLSFRPSYNWKIFASWNMSLRMPTFTDLFYKSPTQQGNIGLKPEKAQALNLGIQYRSSFLRTNVKGFFQKGTDMIDWVMYSANDSYHSANFRLDNMGVEISSTLSFRNLINQNSILDKLNISYNYIYQNRHDDQEIFKSSNALEYLRHKFVARLDHHIWKKLNAEWAFRWQNRMGGYIKYDTNHQSTGDLISYPAFSLLDLKISWNDYKYNLYVEGNNLLNKSYYDFGNIPQPGFWFRAGFKYRINFK